jgi:hypothetical protein
VRLATGYRRPLIAVASQGAYPCAKRVSRNAETFLRPDHVSAQAERTHVGPHVTHVLGALRTRTCLTSPATRNRGVLRPERVLLFIVDQNAIDLSSSLSSKNINVPSSIETPRQGGA